MRWPPAPLGMLRGVFVRSAFALLLAIAAVGCPAPDPGDPTPPLDDDDAVDDDDAGPVLEDCPPPDVVDPPLDPADCNGDGDPDAEQLAAGEAFDCDGDGVLDECEVLDDACVSYGARRFVEYDAGNLPIVLSAPHGGLVEPEDIPDRAAATGARDINTIQLARAIDAALFARTGRHAHLIVCQLHRDKIDCNRSLETAQDGHPETEAAWFEYHAFIDAAKRAAVAQYGRALYIDLHGLAASRDKNEIGYLLYKAQLYEPDDRLAHPAYVPRASIRTAAEEGGDLVELLRGITSLGAGLQAAGFDAVPSPAHPDPGYDDDGEPGNYFNGGYNTGRHGSRAGGPVDGLQIETVWGGVRDTEASRAAFGGALADAVLAWLPTHLAVDPEADDLVSLGPVRGWASERGGTAEIAVRRHGRLQPATVQLGWGGDLTDPPSSVPFAAGESEVVLEVGTPEDGVEEGPREALVEVLPGAGYNVDPEGRSRTIPVVDADRAGLWVEPFAELLPEGTVGDARFRRDTCGDVAEVTVEHDGGADLDVTESVVFDAATSAGSVAIAAVEDGEGEAAERPTVTLRFGEQAIEIPLRVVDDAPAVRGRWDGRIDGALLLSSAPTNVAAAVLPTVADGPRAEEDGPSGTYLSFDGEDDVVLVDDIALDGPFTVAFAFRAHPDLPDRFGYLYGHGNVNGPNHLNVYLRTNGGVRTSLRGADEASDFDALDVAGTFRDAQWHHYAVVVDPAAPSAVVYLDGVESASAARGAAPFDPPHPIFLGGRWDMNPDRDYIGDLDDILVVRSALTAAEVSALATPFVP